MLHNNLEMESDIFIQKEEVDDFLLVSPNMNMEENNFTSQTAAQEISKKLYFRR